MSDQATTWISELLDVAEPRYTNAQLIERAEISYELADRLWRSLGFPDTPDGVRAWSDEDVQALRLAAEGLDAVEPAEREHVVSLLLEEARLFSAHLASIAELELDVLPEFLSRGVRRDVVADVGRRGMQHSQFGWLVFYLFRRQLDVAARRRAELQAESRDQRPTVTVAFLDLVGFTALVERLGPQQLRRLLTHFQSLTSDVVAESGGRIVKLIGDEVMYACADAEQAAAAGLEILQDLQHLNLPARGGLATGPVLHQAGDYFGQAVNRASRLVDTAGAGQLVLDEHTHGVLSDAQQLMLTSLATAEVKGIGALRRWEVRAR